MTVQRMLPLYEAKMVHHYDHRWATYERNGQVRDVLPAEKMDPTFAALPRYWVRQEVVGDRLTDRWSSSWLFGWRDICRSTDERTAISSMEPEGASPEGGTLLCLPKETPALSGTVLTANFNAFVFDFVARQKVGGTHLKYFTMRQLPTLSPEIVRGPVPWGTGRVDDWIVDRVIELVFTAHDMRALAEELGDDGEPFVWSPERRVWLRAELDAAFFHLYGVDREDVDYIMETFPIVKRKDIAAHGSFRTKEAILSIYDAMARATEAGREYETVLSPPPGEGARHEAREQAS